MISIYNLKPKFQQLLKPVLEFLHRRSITANQITSFSIFLSFMIAVGFWFSDKYNILFLCLPIGLFLRMALNALDGMMAKTYNQQSKKGEILNEVGDIFSDLAIFFPLLKFEYHIIYLVVLFISLSIINEFAGILGKAVSGQRRYEGPMGKSDRAFMIGAYGIVAFLGYNQNEYMKYFFILLILLVTISTFVRLKKSL
jgi:CDP-diacylglycerol--glycerol-3-phosphate 3-phosphatidyltransferase